MKIDLTFGDMLVLHRACSTLARELKKERKQLDSLEARQVLHEDSFIRSAISSIENLQAGLESVVTKMNDALRVGSVDDEQV